MVSPLGQTEFPIRYLGDVQRLTLGPDDVLVISTETRISNEVAERLRTDLQRIVPGRKVLILADGMKVGVLAAS